jgi:hypothetical protein
MRARTWLPVVLLALAVTVTVRTTAQHVPCDVTCVDVTNPTSCTTYVTYQCSTCLLLRPCRGFGVPGTQVCFDFAEEGLRITHQVCADGRHADSWSAALCGSCYG